VSNLRISPEEYLLRPYKRLLIPDPKTGTFTAMIEEFPGCITEGSSPDEAYSRLETVAAGWIEAAAELGQKIPDPQEENTYSGKFPLRLPKSVHRDVAIAAEQDGVSMNQFVLTAVAERIGGNRARAEMTKEIQTEMKKATTEVFYAAMSGVTVGNSWSGTNEVASTSQENAERVVVPNYGRTNRNARN